MIQGYQLGPVKLMFYQYRSLSTLPTFPKPNYP